MQYLLKKFTPLFTKILVSKLCENRSSSFLFLLAIFYQQLKRVLNTACLAPMIQRTCERSSVLWFSSSGSPVYVSILVNFKQYNCHDHCWNALLFATETTNFVHTKNSEVQIFAYFLRYFHQNRTRERATCRNSANFSFREVRTFFWVGIECRRFRETPIFCFFML